MNRPRTNSGRPVKIIGAVSDTTGAKLVAYAEEQQITQSLAISRLIELALDTNGKLPTVAQAYLDRLELEITNLQAAYQVSDYTAQQLAQRRITRAITGLRTLASSTAGSTP